MTTPIVAYLRVSTQQQGRSGLGIEAQRAIIADYAARAGRPIVAEFVEVQSGKGSDALERRPELANALQTAKRLGATLAVAKLDRLSRDVAFIAGLMSRSVAFVVATMPEADSFALHIYAALAQQERRMIADRTRQALAAAKQRGAILGNPNVTAVAELGRAKQVDQADADARRLAPTVRALRNLGNTTLRALADAMNAARIRPARGDQWSAETVRRLLARIDRLESVAA